MTYLTQTRIAADPHIILRAAACATVEGIPDARFWAQEHAMRLAVTPGWAAAYKASTSEEPGTDESVITDQMILAAVHDLWAAEQLPAEPASLPDPA